LKTAIYPGSFDPITNGHLDVIKRALKIFDRLIIAVGESFDKKPLFSVQERKEMIAQATSRLNVEVDEFSGLLVDYAALKKTDAIIRGLRAVSNFEYEFQMAVMNRKLNQDVETVFFMTDKDYFYLSSSAVKEIAGNNGKIDCLVPDVVKKALEHKFKAR